ncbi:class I SAM-dependent methyltransferase [Rhizobiaceae bacterium BDR2-2]|uniref:Class I SAM-dependent methyltransferase n=1 Tax=Ectorhizobium quercum TaxID=2965071 RepID=A0AAE3N4B2_9HYPH|nr:class I SAM-dependent methyltransferase [Ectorhizobium quercum]MCX8999691.1 class I SAM-dependent methyltransferase [Ectorhizobium quercum]
MDEKVRAVLNLYHARMEEEWGMPREAPGGRDGGQDMRMRAIGPDTGRFLNTLARGLRAPTILEIGTSFGYSSIWLAEAARAAGGRLVSMELHGYKSAHAREMAGRAGLAGQVAFRVGNALELIGSMEERPDLVFLDCWKDLYAPCLEVLLPKLRPGAVIVADNILRPGGPEIQRYVQAVRAVPGMASVLLPIGTGMEISRLPAE